MAWVSDPSCESKSYEIMTEEGDESTTSGIWIIIGLPPYVLQELLRKYGVPENLFGRVCVIIDKIEKKPTDEIKKELGFTGISDDAIEQLLQVVSLDDLEDVFGGAGEAVADLKQLFSLAEKFGYSEDLIDDVILLNEKDLLPELGQEVENIVCALDKDIQGAAATVATVLRIKGQTVDLELESKPLKWVFKRAARINARRLVLVEKTEWEDGSIGSPSSLTWYQSLIHAVQPDPHRSGPNLAHRSGPNLAHRSLPEHSEIDAQITIISRGRIRHKLNTVSVKVLSSGDRFQVKLNDLD
ncbi:BnaC04g29020D [Brassica napus]|uniref:histidine--tRNA ligase n=1 Tax=Brassica napus TaxID=3708 RepID=A0A078FIC3_BRANA|nr:BnaC04g29020D [Brassica napus]